VAILFSRGYLVVLVLSRTPDPIQPEPPSVTKCRRRAGGRWAGGSSTITYNRYYALIHREIRKSKIPIPKAKHQFVRISIADVQHGTGTGRRADVCDDFRNIALTGYSLHEHQSNHPVLGSTSKQCH
jgi:hypothetical protein